MWCRILVLIMIAMVENAGFAMHSFPETYQDIPQKKKSIKKKRHKHKSKKKRKKANIYSEKKIEKILEKNYQTAYCNRLDCATNLKLAKSCLKTKPMRRRHSQCFRAFCAYGCNDHDYATNPEIYDFCNKTCSSRKYSILF